MVASLIAATGFVTPAHGAPRPSRPAPARTDAPDSSARAVADAGRNTFNEGVRLYKKRKYNEALAAFLQSFALTRNPAVLVNLGQTQLRLGSPLEAAHYFQRFLDEAKDAAPDLRARVEKALIETRNQLGTLEISAPEGAEIGVDGDVVGRTPLPAPVDVLPGRHEVTMSSTAGRRTEEVDVAAGTTRAIKLMPQAAARPAPAAPKSAGEAPEPPGFFSPPSTVAPVYVAGAVGLVAFTAAIVLNGIRVNAERNTTTATEALVRNNKNPASCSDANANDPTILDACATIKDSSRITRNTTVPFNTTLWVGVGATGAAVAWYFIAPKPDVSSTTTGSAHTPLTVAPLVGPSTGGAVVLGTF